MFLTTGCLKFILAILLAGILYKVLGLVGLIIGIFVLTFMMFKGDN